MSLRELTRLQHLDPAEASGAQERSIAREDAVGSTRKGAGQ